MNQRKWQTDGRMKRQSALDGRDVFWWVGLRFGQTITNIEGNLETILDIEREREYYEKINNIDKTRIILSVYYTNDFTHQVHYTALCQSITTSKHRFKKQRQKDNHIQVGKFMVSGGSSMGLTVLDCIGIPVI